MLQDEQLDAIIHICLLSANQPMTLKQLQALFIEDEAVDEPRLQAALTRLMATALPYELREVASGYRFQSKTDYIPWLSRLFAEKAPKYGRATLETLALIAYRQPITRAEIDEIRGVSSSAPIIKTLMEREWVYVVGQRELPGRPSLYATTKNFLDYFNLKHLTELPLLTELTPLPV